MHYSVEETKKLIIFVILAKLMSSHRASGFIANISRPIACQGSTATIDFDFNLQGESIVSGSKVWFFNRIPVAEDTGSGFTALTNYTSRLTSHLSHGMTLSSVTTADSGTYEYEILLVTGFTPKTATASLTVYIGPLPPSSPSGCSVSTSQSGSTVTCTISGNCGTPPLTPSWVNFTTRSNQFECTVKGTYQCCATSVASTSCYSGSPNDFCILFDCAGTTTSTTTTVTSSSTSMSSSTSISGSTVIATNNTSTSTNPKISGSTTINNTTSNKSKSDIDIKVIVPAVVVPCGLLIIGGIILVVCCVRSRTGRNVCESPDGMAVQDKGSNIEGWKQSLGHGKAADNLNAVYTTPDGFVIYPGSAAMFTARSYKDKKHLDVTDHYSRPYPGTYHHQAEYFPSTYTSARAYTHKDKKHHGVTDPYSRPYTGMYGYQAAYVPNTYMSARTYAQKGKKYDYEGPIHKQASHQMATSRPVYDQTTYYPQTGHYGQSSQDVYYSGGGQYSYGKRSRSHYDHSGRKQQREYYNQYEMADYGGNRVGYRHTKQDTAFYY